VMRFNSVFETVVVCLLVLIFQAVGNYFTALFRMDIEENLIHRAYLIGLYDKHGDPEVREAREQLNELGRHYKKQDVHYWINVTVNWLAYLIVLFRLIYELVLA